MPELSLQDIDAAIDKEMASPQVNFAAHHLLRYELIIKGMAGSVVIPCISSPPLLWRVCLSASPKVGAHAANQPRSSCGGCPHLARPAKGCVRDEARPVADAGILTAYSFHNIGPQACQEDDDPDADHCFVPFLQQAL